jgi:transketolase
MGAICNGLALSGGFVPYGATFLIFSDYVRPSVRLSALMGLQTLWVFTHDSIFLGEDGPTHQPIEQIASLRLIPNLHVIRPADGVECAAAWTLALQRKNGPTVLALTRQKVPNLPRDAKVSPRDALRGAYVLQDAAGAGVPDLILVGTGSEVQLALGAKARLEATGLRVRVVSAPCLEQFAAESDDYKESVLPKGVRRVSMEAGRTEPWRALVGLDGLALGLDHFGASAPDKVLAEKFGLTVEAVTARIEAWWRKG